MQYEVKILYCSCCMPVQGEVMLPLSRKAGDRPSCPVVLQGLPVRHIISLIAAGRLPVQ